jgi:hypothetical protein
MMLVLVACSSNPTPEVATSTPELQVVVFSTEAPTPILTPTLTPTRAPTPTAAFGVSVIASPTPNAGQTSPGNRPPNINPLTGLKVSDPVLLKRRPIMVRVGNDPEARPQVALNQADIVYEELVEWWITRFTAIYLSQDPETIAPIRSARLINLQLTPQYQGALANSGGSDEVRWELSQSDLVNLDEFFVPQPYFYRENEGWQTRLAFDAAKAREYLKDEGLEAAVRLRGFVFNPQLDLKTLPQEAVSEAKEVIIPYPPTTSQAKWQYDPTSGKYLRFTTGEPMMAFDGQQITADNVIIYFADHQDTNIVEDSNGATSIRIIVNGLGTAWLLRDGQVLKGNWETDGRQTPHFIFNNGLAMPLKPGNTWVQVVPLDYQITIDGVDHDRLKGPVGDVAKNKDAGNQTVGPTPTSAPTPTPIGARPRSQ